MSLLRAAWPGAQSALAAALAAPEPERPGDPQVLAFPAPVAAPVVLARLAASEELPSVPALPAITRVPHSFSARAWLTAEPGAGFQAREAPAEAAARLFDRPGGSYEARAFGNVVHRFLPVVAARLAEGQGVTALLRELRTWTPRLQTALRAEGISMEQARSRAGSVLQALTGALSDPAGEWLLSPHLEARSETELTVSPLGTGQTLRADRTFRAGSEPLAIGSDYLWIVDYKTGAPGGRAIDDYLQEQKQQYRGQLETYARAAAAGGFRSDRLRLALYFPLVPALVHWNGEPQTPEA